MYYNEVVVRFIYKKIFTACILLTIPIILSAQKPAISILYFENSSVDKKDSFSKALTEMVISSLSEIEEIQIIEREKMNNVVDEMRLGMTGLVDERSAPKIGNILGAKYIVSGNLLIAGNAINVSYKLTEVETAKIIGGGNISGGIADIISVQYELSVDILESLKKVFPSIKSTIKKVKTRISYNAAVDYGSALEFKDTGDYKKAQELLNKLIGKNPEFANAKGELSDIEKRLKTYDAKRDSVIGSKAQSYTWDNYQQVTGSYSSSTKYSMLLEYCKRGRGQLPKYPSSSMKTSELNDYYIIFALNGLKRWAEFKLEAESFLKKYPASIYYSGVRGFLNSAMRQIQQIENNRNRVKSEISEYIEETKSSSPFKKNMAYFQIAMKYFGYQLYTDALDNFKKLDFKVLEENGINGDDILQSIFMCYYGLVDKKNAEKVYKTLKMLYPDSSIVYSLQSMLDYFPE